MELLLATTSQKKLAELMAIFSGLSVTLVAPGDAGLDLDVEETGETFRENAILKAEAFARAGGRPALADDSGLEIDALGGEPGVRSRRYAGPHASDADRIALVLDRLRDVPLARRTARFRCVMALAAPGKPGAPGRGPGGANGSLAPVGLIGTVEGTCEGIIAPAPRGENGFGYDPIFLLPHRGQTMAELTSAEKHAVSHRGRAGAAARRLLEQWLVGASPARR